MGGNALSIESARLSRLDYERVAPDVVRRLQAAYPSLRVAAIEAYREKPDFGDLDVLVSSHGVDDGHKHGDVFDPFVAAKAIDAIEVVRNGPVTSVGIVMDPALGTVNGNVFQVDFIRSAPESFDYGYQYFRMNDAGNLIGRIAHKMGVSHRHDGLFMVLRDGDHKFGEIELTKDYARALTFLGYKPQTFLDGFDTLAQMFDYIASSDFFNPSIYLLENRNNISRIRDRKRPSYTAFLKWCEESPELALFDHTRGKLVGKEIWHARVQEHFPHFANEHALAVSRLERGRTAQARFNGVFVSEVSGLHGKALGGLMQRIRSGFKDEDENGKGSGAGFREFVLGAGDAELVDLVKRVAAGMPAPVESVAFTEKRSRSPIMGRRP